MATYKEIQTYIKLKTGKSVKTCWIADMKSRHNLITRKAPNRVSDDFRVYPCPERFKSIIEDSFRYFNMIK